MNQCIGLLNFEQIRIGLKERLFHVELTGETDKRFVRAFGNKDLNGMGHLSQNFRR